MLYFKRKRKMGCLSSKETVKETVKEPYFLDVSPKSSLNRDYPPSSSMRSKQHYGLHDQEDNNQDQEPMPEQIYSPRPKTVKRSDDQFVSVFKDKT